MHNCWPHHDSYYVGCKNIYFSKANNICITFVQCWSKVEYTVIIHIRSYLGCMGDKKIYNWGQYQTDTLLNLITSEYLIIYIGYLDSMSYIVITAKQDLVVDVCGVPAIIGNNNRTGGWNPVVIQSSDNCQYWMCLVCNRETSSDHEVYTGIVGSSDGDVRGW